MHLGVLGVQVVGGLGLALPELAAAGAGGVVVGGGGAVFLFLLVVACDPDLEEDGDEEEEASGACPSQLSEPPTGVDEGSRMMDKLRKRGCSRSDDGDGKSRRVDSAREPQVREVCDGLAPAETKPVLPVPGAVVVGRPVAERGGDVAGAGICAVAGEDGEGDEGGAEAEVEEHGDEGEELDAAEAAGGEDCENGVEDGDAGDALDGLPVARDGEVMVGEDGEEVGVDAKDDGCAAEFEGVEEAVGFGG